MALRPKHERFCVEFLRDLNAGQAAIRAGYSAKTAVNYASKLRHRPDIAARIETMMAERAGRTGVTLDQVVDELAAIAFTDPSDLFCFGPDGVRLRPSATVDPRALRAVSEVSETRTKTGGGVRVKLHDKARALDLLAKHLGAFAETKGLSDADALKLLAAARKRAGGSDG